MAQRNVQYRLAIYRLLAIVDQQAFREIKIDSYCMCGKPAKCDHEEFRSADMVSCWWCSPCLGRGLEQQQHLCDLLDRPYDLCVPGGGVAASAHL